MSLTAFFKRTAILFENHLKTKNTAGTLFKNIVLNALENKSLNQDGGKDLSIVIPCYNTGESIKNLILRIFSMSQELNISFEVVLVNDASPRQETWVLLTNLAKEFSFIKSVDLTRNFGQQSATLCGLSLAKGDYVVTMDDDGQHNPENIKLMWPHRDRDIVIARLKSRKDGIARQLTSKIKAYFDYVVLNKPKHIRLSPFRLMKRRVVDDMLKIKTNAPFIPALMFYATRDVVNVDVVHEKRAEGKSNYDFIKRLRLFTLIIINNSSLILNYTSIFGVFSSIMSLLFILFLFLSKFFFGVEYEVGWPSVFSAVLFFGGLNLFILGLIGEYLVRLFMGVEKRPPFLIKKVVEHK